MQNSRLLNAAAIAGCIFAASVLVASVLAADYPALDIVNNGLPLLCVGLIAVLILSIALRSAMLIVTSAGLLAVALAILIPNLAGAAPDAARDAERFMRIASFNMWGKGDLHASRVEDFLKDSDADAVVLEEVRWKHEDFLKRLQATYPHQSGTHGLVILSKHPIVDKGRLDRPGEPYWRSLIVSWARLDVNGTEVDLVGAHMARPFFPAQHSVDLETLARFVASRPGHVIVAGDFNSAPWTRHLQSFATETGLRRLNTFQPTWPARWRELPLLPLLPIDNVFISSGLDRIEFTAGPRLESDHLPVIADIALAH